MKQSNLLRTMEVFPGIDVVRNFSFKTIGTREKSAHFQVDCFECLSPHKTVA